MPPTYDYRCIECGFTDIINVSYKARDTYRPLCSRCESDMERFYGNVNARTPKTSASFVGNYGRGMREKAILADLKKSADLEAKALDHHPDSTEYKDMKREAKERKSGKSNKKG